MFASSLIAIAYLIRLIPMHVSHMVSNVFIALVIVTTLVLAYLQLKVPLFKLRHDGLAYFNLFSFKFAPQTIPTEQIVAVSIHQGILTIVFREGKIEISLRRMPANKQLEFERFFDSYFSSDGELSDVNS